MMHQLMKSTRSTTVAIVRQEIGTPAVDFGKMIGKSLGTVKSLEAGRLKLSEKTAKVISEKTGVSMGWLLTYDVTTRPVDQFGNPWNKETFENIEGRQMYKKTVAFFKKSTEYPTIVFLVEGPEDLMIFLACKRLRAILSNQKRSAKLFLSAAARTDRFLNDLQKVFGIAPDLGDNTKSLSSQPSARNAPRAYGHKSSQPVLPPCGRVIPKQVVFLRRPFQCKASRTGDVNQDGRSG
jgi:hypothetical protein